ncbi:MAG: LysR family transcriptional regulator [Oscillospiraceae bacterium]|nr:LysR family transcriptional regulator [Oscillospiraceae bacterium]
MTLLQMSYIIEVEKCGSINRAAQCLFISQAALSSAIAEAEKELGITIFHRSNRGVSLTDDGRSLIAMITPLVEGNRKISRYYSEQNAENRVRLSIASQRYPFCAKAFVEFLHLLNEPRLDVSLKEMEMSSVISEVSTRQSDLGILFVSNMTEHFIRRILDEKHLEFFELSTVRPRVFMRKEHPLAGKSSVHLEQLYDYPYAMFTQSESNMNYAEEAVVGTASDFNRVVYVNDRATIYNIMAHTDAVSTGSGVLPDGYGDDRLVTVPLADADNEMRLGYIHLRGLPLSELEQRFVDILRRILNGV